MSRVGVKHLVKCVCVLPQLSKLQNPPSHEFVVFSIYDNETDDFESTFVKCDNCGIVHKITDICSSTIMKGKEDLRTIVTIEDVKNSVTEKLSSILEQHHCDLPTWQQVAWILETQSWGSSVILTSEYIDGTRQGKSLIIISESLYKIVTFNTETVAVNK